jgi:hypothetical protein
MSKELHENEMTVGTGSVMTTASGIAGLPPDLPPVAKSVNMVRRNPTKKRMKFKEYLETTKAK